MRTFKLQSGDFISTDGLSRDQRELMLSAFLNAGVPRCEPFPHHHSAWNYIGWGDEGTVICTDKVYGDERIISFNDILSALNTKGED